ncbi:MAG: sigma-54 dependent transcriptional regulator [Albidovulum sp.]
MSQRPLLLVEDTPSLQLVYATILKSAGHLVQCASDAATGLSAFKSIQPPVVLLDLTLPDRDGLDLMRDFLALEPDTAVIVITANGSINKAVAAMRAGAHEFLVKPFDEQRFLNAVENALSNMRPHISADAPTSPIAPLGDFIGHSKPMVDVYAKIRSVARSMATVFVTGESGTGKELCAQAVHDISNRGQGPFIPLNCGAIPSELLESEVFGHVKGSFTGAISDKPGAAMAADGGTLFLDEICELDLNLQTKLLRFLETSTIQPVGAAKPRKINVRIVCATNRDPLEAVKQGHFREDLYYRLHVVPIHLPPLRKRDGDVIIIAETALKRFAKEEKRQLHALDEDVKTLFRSLPWPGNVRQLLNVIRHVVVLNDGPVVTLSMLPIELLQTSVPGQDVDKTQNVALGGLVGRSLAEIERLVINETIRHYGGSVPRAARILEVSPSTLYRKMESWKNMK